MTKHPAQDTQEPPGRDGRLDTGVESHPRSSGRKQPLSGATGKWLIVKGFMFWHAFRPDADRRVFGTWQQAVAHVNQQLRAERHQQAARARFIEIRPGATPSTTDVRVVFRCPACMSKEA